MSVSKARPPASDDPKSDDVFTPRPLTPAENVVLTLKVLAVMGLLGAVLWAANLWTAAR